MSDNFDMTKAPGAKWNPSTGYWGHSTDDAKDDAFERVYRQLIPKNKYKTATHNPLTCKVCTYKNMISYCETHGLQFGEMFVRLGRGKRILRCNPLPTIFIYHTISV